MSDNAALARQWFEEVWNNKDESAIDRMFSKTGVAYGFPNPASQIIGPDAFKEAHRAFCQAFPDLKVEVLDIVSEGDRVAVRWKATMTHLGDGIGLPPSGKSAELHGSSFTTIEDGQLVHGWNHMDFEGFLKSLSS